DGRLDTAERVARGWVGAIEAMEAHGENICAIRYEALVQNPDPVLQEFGEWLGVDPDRFDRRLIRATSVGKFRGGLTAEDLSIIEEIAGSTRRRLGYA